MKQTTTIILIAALCLMVSCTHDLPQPYALREKAIESTFTDERDGQSYKCVTIGKQTWLAENLKYRLPLGGYDGCVTYDEMLPKFTNIAVNKAAFKDSVNLAIKTKQITAKALAENFILDFLNPKNKRYYPLPLQEYLDSRDSNNPQGLTFADTYKVFLPIIQRINTNLLNAEIAKITDKSTDYSYVKEYGYLYSYTAALRAVPNGWRLPTDEDWKELERNIGMTDGEIDKLEEWRGVNQGELLRQDNKAGFYALLAGGRAYGLTNGNTNRHFINKEVKAYFWTTTQTEPIDSMNVNIIRAVQLNNPKIYRGTSIQEVKDRPVNFSVRCVKN